MKNVSLAWDLTYFILLVQCYSAVCFRVENAYTVHLGNCSAIQLFACGWGMLTQFIWAILVLFSCLLAGGECLHSSYGLFQCNLAICLQGGMLNTFRSLGCELSMFSM